MTNTATAVPAGSLDFRFKVLGTVEAANDGRAVPLGGPKQRAVLAVLVARAGQRVPTDSIVDALYGDEPPDGARRSVQTYVSNLRREFGDVIRPQPDGYTLDVPRRAIDAATFEDAVAEALEKVVAQPAEAAESIRSALSLWRGHPYADVDGGTVLAAETSRLMDRRLVAVEARVEADLMLGRHEQLVPELAALTAEHPYREKMRSQHMLALYRSGRQADALRAYEQTRSDLLELGLEPSPELQELNLQILDHDSRIAFSQSPPVTRKALLAIDIDAEFLERVVGSEDRIAVLSTTDAAVLDVLARHQGEIFAQRLNATFAHFEQLEAALAAATDVLQQAPQLGGEPLRPAVRAAVDIGDVESGTEGTLVGPVVIRTAGLVALARPGQAVLSTAAHAAASRLAGWTMRTLGEHLIPGLDREETLHQLVVRGLPEEFPPPRHDPIPARVGGMRSMPGYELRSEVRRNSDWVTWRAYQPSVGREVAIKVMGPELAGRPEFVRRFELEALTVARLNHPRIVPLYDYWRDLTGAYLVHPWIDGTTLATRTMSAPLSIDEATRMLDEVGSALEAAHGVGVAHGHVSSDTILVGRDGAFYLTGFGIAARASSPSTSHTAQQDVAALASALRSGLDPAADVPHEVIVILDKADGQDSVAGLRSAWHSAIGPGAAAEDRFTITRNPYRGLGAFTAADARDFFGRDAIVAELMSAVGARRFTAVVGPSGVGKSSLVQAGLLPRLMDGGVPGSADWFVATMQPGGDPYEAMAAALLRVAISPVGGLRASLAKGDRGMLRALGRLVPPAAEILVVVDQFEELFTLTDPEVRAQFLRSLTMAVTDPASNVRVVVTVRADFFDQPLGYPGFGELMRSATIPVSAPTDEELRQIIERPARGVGVELERGMTERVLADAGDQPGRLPLVEYALTETFHQRSADVMRVADYEAVGGVVGALGRTAELTYAELSSVQQEAARQIFLRLVTMADADRVGRRRARMAELSHLDLDTEAIQAVIDGFSRHRLIMLDRDPTTHGPTVEFAHEAIFTAWPRLAAWIEDHGDDLAARRRLLEATAEWESADRNEALLLTDARLAYHQAWAESTSLFLTRAERDLLEASTRREEERAEELRVRRRRILQGFAAAAVVAMVLAVAAWGQRNNARTEASLAQGRELVLEAERVVADDPELATHLALAAIEAFDAAGDVPASAVDALRKATAADRVVARIPGGNFVDVSPDGAVLVTGHESGGAALRDRSTLELLDVVEIPGVAIIGALFGEDPDELLLRVHQPDAAQVAVMIWTLSTGGVETFPGSGTGENIPIAFDVSHGGDLLALASEGTVRVLDRSGTELYQLEELAARSVAFPPLSPDAGGLDFSESGVLGVVFVHEDGTVILLAIDGATGDEVARVQDLPFEPENVALSPDGTLAVISSLQGAVGMIDLEEQRVLWSHNALDVARKPVWIDEGGTILLGGEAPLSLLDAGTGELIRQIPANRGLKWSYAAIPGTDLVAVAGLSDFDTLLIDVASSDHAEIAAYPAALSEPHIQVGDDGRFLLMFGNDDRTVAVAEVESGEIVTTRRGAQPESPWGWPFPVFSRTGGYVAWSEADGTFHVWEVPDGRVIYTAPTGWYVVGLSDDASLVVIHDEDPTTGDETQIVRVADGEVLATVNAGGRVNSSEFTPDSRYLLTNNNGLAEPTIRLWDTADGRLVNAFGSLDTYSGGESHFTRDGRILVVAGHGGDIFVFDVAKIIDGEDAAAALDRLIPAHDSFSGASISPDGSIIATGAWNERLKIWDLGTGTLIDELGATEFKSWAFHPTEPWIYLAEGGSVVVHTLDLGELVDIARTRLSRDMTEQECRLFLRRSCDE